MATGTMSPAELMAGLRDDTKALLTEVKAERAAAGKALAEMKATVAKVVQRQTTYEKELDERFTKTGRQIGGLQKIVRESTETLDLEGDGERVAARIEEVYSRGEAMADRREKILNNSGLVLGYSGQWMLFAAVLVWGIGFLVWSLVRGWSMLVAESSGTWGRVLGFGGWAVFTATVLAGLFLGGKWLYSKWKQ